MDYDDLLTLVKRRRSIRRFKPDPVPDEYVEKILEVARWSPSGANCQPWQFVVVRKPELRRQIFDVVSGGRDATMYAEEERDEEIRFKWHPPSFADAPVFIVLCGDPRLQDCFPLSALRGNGESIFRSSLANAFLYMTLAATTLGLGSQWVTGVSGSRLQPTIKQLLGIPEGLMIYDMLAVGYPDMVPPPRFLRKKADLVHYDRYDPSKMLTDQQVRDFIVRIRSGQPL